MASLRDLLLPREHGIWGLLAGAALVGLPPGHDLAGLPLLGAALAGVVLRQACIGKGASVARALVLVLAAASAAGCILATIWAAGDRSWEAWLIGAGCCGVPMLVPIPGRPWWGSALVALPTGLLAGAIAIAGGAPLATAGLAAIALAMHQISIVPLVRAQTRGGPLWSALAIDLHILALLIAIGLWASGWVGSGIPLVFALGLARTAWLVDKRTPMSISPMRIGATEMAWLLVLATGIHYGLRDGAC